MIISRSLYCPTLILTAMDDAHIGDLLIWDDSGRLRSYPMDESPTGISARFIAKGEQFALGKSEPCKFQGSIEVDVSQNDDL